MFASALRSRWIAPSAILAGLVVSAGVVWQASYSAFSAPTSNPTSNWAAGTVALADDDAGTALFSASGLKPGSTGQKCIAVTSNGTLPSTVKLYGTGAATTNALSSSINVTITQGTGGTFLNNCSGFTPLGTGSSVFTGTLATFASASTSFATGLGTWAPTGSAPETRVFQLTYTLDPAAPNSAQGGTAALGFTWEAQNS